MTGGQPKPVRSIRGVSASIAGKLYCFAFLSLLAVMTLSISSIYF
jgi:hypothetical protein